MWNTVIYISLYIYAREEKKDGLACKLGQPLQKAYKPPAQFKDFIVRASDIVKTKKLGGGFFGEVFLAKCNQCAAAHVLLSTVNIRDGAGSGPDPGQNFDPDPGQIFGLIRYGLCNKYS